MKKAIQKLQKVYPKLTVRGIFHCPFLFLICSHSARECFFMLVCDVELSVYKKILKESRVLFMGLVRHYNSR